jgi:exopolysaccharide biosynthesis predicted pyruvyltransferase EpsI
MMIIAEGECDMAANLLQTEPLAAAAPAVPLFHPQDPYVRFLREHRHRRFYLKPWGGNSGDVLIWLGTEELLKDLHVHRTIDPREADFLLIPGGNQTMWHGNVQVWNDAWSRWPDKPLVVGPMTAWLGYTRWDQEVRDRGSRVQAIFARDPASYAVLQTCGFPESLTTGLSHDPALYLRDSELIHLHKKAATSEFVLAAFRDDFEGTKDLRARLGRWVRLVPERVQRKIDCHGRRTSCRNKLARMALRTRSTKPLRICDVSRLPFPYFLETIRSAQEVHTDRLHVMLLAAMLGKPTYAYPTAFRKLERLYEHSVKDWAHVEFVSNR